MLSNLQILRAFAALNVVLFHILEIGLEQGFGIPTLEFLRGWGANGVDIFFVLSGFIMMYIAERRPRRPAAFLYSRAIRIIPIYWVLTLLGCAAVIVAGDFRGNPVSAEAIIASFLFVTRWTTLDMPILYVGWTLEWEMLFYLIFGACLLFTSRTVQFILPLLILGGLVFFVGQNPIILEFGFGMIVAKLSKQPLMVMWSGLLALIGAILLVATIWIKPDLGQAVFWGVPSALLVAGLVNIKQWTFRLGEHLGDASYSIYLIQVFTIPVFYKLAERLVPNMSTLVLGMACLVVTVLAGSLCYRVLERPVQKYFARHQSQSRKINPASKTISPIP